MLDAESVAGHLLKAGSVFGFLAGYRRELFRASVPADVTAAVITLQALHGLSDSETVDAVTFDLRWKAACGLPVTAGAFHATTLTYWRRRLAASSSTVESSARRVLPTDTPVDATTASKIRFGRSEAGGHPGHGDPNDIMETTLSDGWVIGAALRPVLAVQESAKRYPTSRLARNSPATRHRDDGVALMRRYLFGLDGRCQCLQGLRSRVLGGPAKQRLGFAGIHHD